MALTPIQGRKCRWCAKVLVQHEGEEVRAFNKRAHCNRECATEATKAVWHEDVTKIRKGRRQ